MEEIYWRPGNGAAFLELVQQLTAEPLSADAWVSRLKQSVDSVVLQEEQDYQQAVQTGPKIKPGQHASSWSCIYEASNSSLHTDFATTRTHVFGQSVSCVDILAMPSLRPCCHLLVYNPYNLLLSSLRHICSWRAQRYAVPSLV